MTTHQPPSHRILGRCAKTAGESRRMGRPKALLPYGGRAFLEHLLQVTRHPGVGVTRVVLGANAAEVRQSLQLDPATVIVNAEWTKGQLSSLQVALRSLPAGLTQGVLLCLVDHPLITSQLVGELIERFDRSPRSIVIPTYRGQRGHPVILPSHLYPELLAAPADIGARAVVWAHTGEVLEVATEEEGAVLNLNDPEAFRQAIGK